MLADLHEQGAEEVWQLRRCLGEREVARWLERTYLARVPTPLGEVLVLGPEGRRALGLSPYYLSPPEAAATQLLRRRVREGLEHQGWRYLARPSRQLLLFASAREQPVYVLARYGELTARSVRRVLARLRAELVSSGGVLLLWTQHPSRFHAVAHRANGLLAIQPYRWPLGDGDACVRSRSFSFLSRCSSQQACWRGRG